MMKRGGGGGNRTRAAAAAAAVKVEVEVEKKDGDDQEQLVLFRDMQKRDKERNISLLQPIPPDDYLDSNSGSFPLFRMASAKKFGFDFLNESDKNDYDWLKTPPATPLFASLEMDAGGAPDLLLQRELPILSPHLSRFSGFAQQDVPAMKTAIIMNSRPKSPSPMAARVVPPSRSLGEYLRPTTKTEINSSNATDTKEKSNQNKNNNTLAISSTQEAEEATNHHHPQQQQQLGDPSHHHHQLDKRKEEEAAAAAATGRRLSDDDDESIIPPNLITKRRSTSTSRGRPTTPSSTMILSTNTTRQPPTIERPPSRSISTSRNRIVTTSLILGSSSNNNGVVSLVNQRSSSTTRGRKQPIQQQHPPPPNIFPTYNHHPKHKEKDSTTTPTPNCKVSAILDETTTLAPPPKNLIIKTNRPSSTSRSRPTTPSIKNNNNPTTTRQDASHSRKQSCSPSVSRGRKFSEGNQDTQGGDSIITKRKNQQGAAAAGNGSLAFGSSMVDKVINSRKLIVGEESSERKGKLGTSSTTTNTHSGFGRFYVSKSSTDMPNKHMEVRRDPIRFSRGNLLVKNTTTASINTNLSSDPGKNTSKLQEGTKSVQESWKRKETRRFT